MSTSGAYVVSVALHASLAAVLGVLPLLSEEALPGQASAVIESTPLFVPLPPALGRRSAAPAGRVVPRVAVPAPNRDATASSKDEPLESDATPDSDDANGLGDDIGVAGDAIGTIGSVLVDESATPPPPPPVVRITSGLTAPRVVRRVEPVYPALALAARASATVLLEAEVDPRGHVTRVSVLHGHPLFDAAAIEAVERWRYQPLLLNGVPTAFVLTVTVRFGLR
jgi:periplasmic protein TonB